MDKIEQNLIIREFISSIEKAPTANNLQINQDNEDTDSECIKEINAISFTKTDFKELQSELRWPSKKLNELLYKQKLPRLYRYTERGTVFLFIISAIFMCIDFTFSLTPFGFSGYIMCWLCCGALFTTNLWAKYEWKGKHKRVCVLREEKKDNI